MSLKSTLNRDYALTFERVDGQKINLDRKAITMQKFNVCSSLKRIIHFLFIINFVRLKKQYQHFEVSKVCVSVTFMKLLIVCNLSILSCLKCYAVTSTGCGEGSTKNEAIKYALRDAVENAVGVYIQSNTRIEGYQLTEDEINVFSNALINDYRIDQYSIDDLHHVCLTIETGENIMRMLPNYGFGSLEINTEKVYSTTEQKFDYIESAQTLIKNYVKNYSNSSWEIKLYEIYRSDDYESRTVSIDFSVDCKLKDSYYIDMVNFLSIFDNREEESYLYTSYKQCPGSTITRLDCSSFFIMKQRVDNVSTLKDFSKIVEGGKVAENYWKETLVENSPRFFIKGPVSLYKFYFESYWMPIRDINFNEQEVVLVEGRSYRKKNNWNTEPYVDFLGKIMCGICEESRSIDLISDIWLIAKKILSSYSSNFTVVIYAKDGTLLFEEVLKKINIPLSYEFYHYNRDKVYTTGFKLVVPIDIIDAVGKVEIRPTTCISGEYPWNDWKSDHTTIRVDYPRR